MDYTTQKEKWMLPERKYIRKELQAVAGKRADGYMPRLMQLVAEGKVAITCKQKPPKWPGIQTVSAPSFKRPSHHVKPGGTSRRLSKDLEIRSLQKEN